MSDDVNIEILDGGLGLIDAAGDEICAVIGSCTLGTVNTIVATRSIANLQTSRGAGTGIEAAAVQIKDTGKTVLFVKCATDTAGKVKDSDAPTVAIASSTNATPIVVTTTPPHKLKDGAVVTIAGHLINTTANGTHFVHVLTATTFALVGIAGVGIGVATGTVQDTGVVDLGVSAAGTSVPTVTGTPNDSVQVRFKWITGGTRGVAGAVFAVSYDDGETYEPNRPIGTATSFVLGSTGMTIAFAVGTWIAGDTYSFTCVEPTPSDANIADAMAALEASTQQFRLIHLAHVTDASSATSFDTDLESMSEEYRYTGMLTNARDFDLATDADEEAWEAAIAADFAGYSSSRVSVCAGHYIVESPISRRKYRRPFSWIAAARLMSRPIQEHAGRVRTGRLKRIESRTSDGKIYHDERLSPSLDAARFFTARTRIGRPGWFVKQPRMMAAPGSDYQIWPHRSVIDKACFITYQVLVDVVNDDLQLDPLTGHILEKEAKSIENRLASAYRDGLTAKGACSAVTATVDRDTNIISTKRLETHTRVLPKGYVETIDNDIGFTNPDLNVGS